MGVDFNVYFHLPPECHFFSFPGLGCVFIHPRTGTLYLFNENRQQWLTGTGDPFGGIFGLESWERVETASRQPANILVELPIDAVFYVPELFQFAEE